jgi:hypothetical protein
MTSMIEWLRFKLQAGLARETSPEDAAASERGNSLVEMALILALVVIVAVGVLQALGLDIVAKLMEVANALH